MSPSSSIHVPHPSTQMDPGLEVSKAEAVALVEDVAASVEDAGRRGHTWCQCR